MQILSTNLKRYNKNCKFAFLQSKAWKSINITNLLNSVLPSWRGQISTAPFYFFRYSLIFYFWFCNSFFPLSAPGMAGREFGVYSCYKGELFWKGFLFLIISAEFFSIIEALQHNSIPALRYSNIQKHSGIFAFKHSRIVAFTHSFVIFAWWNE